jgi:hypothetical protein
MRWAAWRALAGAEVIGEANAMLRPDRRWFVSVDTWVPDSFLPLVSAVADDLRQDLYTTVDEGDQAELRNWSAAGFTVLRREHHYLIPTAPDRTRQPGAVLPGAVLPGAVLPGAVLRGRGQVGVDVRDQGDHLADDGPVGAAGHDGDDEGVTGDRLGVGAR